MNDNTTAIIILCSHLCLDDNVKPYEPSEWNKLYEKLVNNKLEPYDILEFNDEDFKTILNYSDEEIDRIKRLIDRSGSIAFELEKYSNIGINIVTRADKQYPEILKNKLGKLCPPLFYYVGNLELAKNKYVGFVGSRSISSYDSQFAVNTVSKIIKNGYGVVSGGAKGIDLTAAEASISNGSICIEYISDSLNKKIKNKDTIKAVINNKLLILSVSKPDAGFNTGVAMMRNKYIYAQSEGTVVVKSDFKKGGTWNGATECLKKKYCPVFCWNNDNYEGNTELIKSGAIPIDKFWNGNVGDYKIEEEENVVQLSLFD